MRARSAELDQRERKFVELFVETNNGARSAIISGYGSNLNSSSVIAGRLLRRVKIRNAIEKRTAEMMRKLDLQPDRIIRGIAEMATTENVEVKAEQKLKALIELAKIAKLYPALQTELSGPNGSPIATASVNVNHTMDIASLEPEQRDQLRQVLLAIKAKSEAQDD